MINVIIVEDDPMVLEVNINFLNQLCAFKLQGSAATGKEALEMIKNQQTDLVLLDVYLPDFSGVELLAKIRKLDIPVDIIAITAARDAKTVHQLFRLGTIDYLVKPFRFERFQKALVNYKKMWHTLGSEQPISQADIDAWLEQEHYQVSDNLPKGLSELTLKQILMALYDNHPTTAEQLANNLGMARVTVRRYLEYLEKKNRIQVNKQYGRVGRPTHYYTV